MKSGHKWLLSSFFISLHLVCGSLTEGAEKTLSKIRVGYVAPTADNVLVAVAQKKDFFKKHGVEVELIAIRGGVQATQAILSNSIQFAQMAGSVVVRAVLSGGDVVMIAGFINRINYLLVSRPEITSAKDLLGKRVASASIGGSVDTILRLGLKGLGVDPASIIILPAGPPQSRLAALSTGQMDATLVAPESLDAVEKAGLKILKDLSDVEVYVQHTGVVVRRDLLRENRELAKNFLLAIIDAIDFYRTQEREALEIMQKFTGIKDPRALRSSYTFHKKLFLQPPYVRPEGFQTVIELIAASEPKARNIQPELFFDNGVLDELKPKELKRK